MIFNNIRISIFTAILLVISLSSVGLGEEIIDSIAAKVDDEIILESEIGYGISTMLLENEIKYPDQAQIDELRAQVLESYIFQKVLLAKAIEETLAVEDRTVEKELTRKLDNLIARVGTQEKLVEYFGKTLRQIKREMRQGVEDGLLIEMLRQQKISNARVRRQDVIEFYESNIQDFPMMPERVALSHILLQVEASDEAIQAAQDNINDVLQLIRGGADFDSMARISSQDPSAPQGGRLGFTNRGDLFSSFEEAAYALEPGQVSEVTQTRYGLHIIKLIDRQGERISTQHILFQLAPTKDDWTRVRDKALRIREEIIGGASFAEFAIELSDDEESAKNGGKLELLPLENIPEDFSSVIAYIDIGDIPEPFDSSYGIHLIRLDERIKSRKLSLTDDWQTLQMLALNTKREQIFSEWVLELKEQHYIWP
jgi:peptidyl-prolyl cis-trans isomerase SurA